MEPHALRRNVDILSPGGGNDIALHVQPRRWTWGWLWYHACEKAYRPYDCSWFIFTGAPRLNTDGSIVSVTNAQYTRVFHADEVVSITGPLNAVAIGDNGAKLNVRE